MKTFRLNAFSCCFPMFEDLHASKVRNRSHPFIRMCTKSWKSYVPASLTLSSSPWEKADSWRGSAGSKLSWVIGQWWKKNCGTILYLNFNPTRVTWKTRDYRLTWLTLALIMGCAAQQQASFEATPHPPEMWIQIWKHSTPFCPDVNSIYYTTNKWKEILMNADRAPWSWGGVTCIITLSSSYLSPFCFHSLINIVVQNFSLN